MNEKQGELTISLERELSVMNAGATKKDVLKTLAANPEVRHLRFNMEKVDYIDSSGNGVLVAAYKEVAARDGMVTLCDVQPRVRAALDVWRMSEWLIIEDAVAAQ